MFDVIYWTAAILVGLGFFAIAVMFAGALLLGLNQAIGLLRERQKSRDFLKRFRPAP